MNILRFACGAESPVDPDGVWETRSRPWSATVFHISQTDAIGARGAGQ